MFSAHSLDAFECLRAVCLPYHGEEQELRSSSNDSGRAKVAVFPANRRNQGG